MIWSQGGGADCLGIQGNTEVCFEWLEQTDPKKNGDQRQETRERWGMSNQDWLISRVNRGGEVGEEEELAVEAAGYSSGQG